MAGWAGRLSPVPLPAGVFSSYSTLGTILRSTGSHEAQPRVGDDRLPLSF